MSIAGGVDPAGAKAGGGSEGAFVLDLRPEEDEEAEDEEAEEGDSKAASVKE